MTLAGSFSFFFFFFRIILPELKNSQNPDEDIQQVEMEKLWKNVSLISPRAGHKTPKCCKEKEKSLLYFFSFLPSPLTIPWWHVRGKDEGSSGPKGTTLKGRNSLWPEELYSQEGGAIPIAIFFPPLLCDWFVVLIQMQLWELWSWKEKIMLWLSD